MPRHSTLIAVLLTVLLVGCAYDGLSDGADVATDPKDRIGSNRIGSNRIGSNRIGSNRIGSNRIGSNRIGSNRIGVNLVDGAPLLSTEEGRDVFSYLVSCAFPSDLTLEATVDGVTYDFPGLFGLAPGWESRALNEDEQRWVSACIIARVNAHDVSVDISMRGRHPALVTSAEEEQTFVLEEGAFYGNIFLPTDVPIEWVACRGSDQAAAETGDLVDRDCAEPDVAGRTLCTFAYAGDCGGGASPIAMAHACEQSGHGYYDVCHTQAGFQNWPPGTARGQVITVFVQE
jgi:hypothetical protein